MKIFINLLFRQKLLIGFGIVWAILLATIVIAYILIDSITQSEKELNDKHFKAALISNRIQQYQYLNRAEVLNYVLVNDTAEREKGKEEIRKNSDSINYLINQLLLLDAGTNQNLLSELELLVESYRQGRDEQFRLIGQNNILEAQQMGTRIQNQRFEKIKSILMRISDNGVEKTNLTLKTDMARAKSSTVLFTILGIAAILTSILIIILLNKTITQPLKKITEGASNIALGDMENDWGAINQKDEIGTLAISFKTMQNSLIEKAEIARQIAEGNLVVTLTPLSEKDTMSLSFQNMVYKLKKQLTNLNEGINILSSSSAEISASITQLASSSTETATAVGEATTTVEEVKQTALISNNKAKMVSENAVKMADISREGNKAITNTINGMSKIKDQMNAIAGMVVRLSEQSQTIGEITSTVNELAEQSNLLAVNAAIEAAKAGEQGRGFTVVAQEIKQLANRSKEATTQVKSILRDIQKSISSAVMATEEGTKAVNEGLTLTNTSGETIRILTESVNEASNAAIQIAASSQQQLEGMNQMVIAMESIREASVQAVTSTQQTVISVNDLQKVGQELDLMMKQYILD